MVVIYNVFFLKLIISYLKKLVLEANFTRFEHKMAEHVAAVGEVTQFDAFEISLCPHRRLCCQILHHYSEQDRGIL